MTLPARPSTDRVAAPSYTRHGGVPVMRRPSQRELVSWSLLTRDFAVAGDVDSAVDAIRDAHATLAELRASSSVGGVH